MTIIKELAAESAKREPVRMLWEEFQKKFPEIVKDDNRLNYMICFMAGASAGALVIEQAVRLFPEEFVLLLAKQVQAEVVKHIGGLHD